MALRVKDKERLESIHASISASISSIFDINAAMGSLTDAQSIQNQRQRADTELSNISTQAAALQVAIEDASKPVSKPAAAPPSESPIEDPPEPPMEQATPSNVDTENGEGDSDGDDN